MKHKHADLIKAWADGAKIEARYQSASGWTEWAEETGGFIWYKGGAEYRIKPEPKPDCITFLSFTEHGWSETPISCYVRGSKRALKLTHDGETGKLKSAEVL